MDLKAFKKYQNYLWLILVILVPVLLFQGCACFKAKEKCHQSCQKVPYLMVTYSPQGVDTEIVWLPKFDDSFKKNPLEDKHHEKVRIEFYEFKTSSSGTITSLDFAFSKYVVLAKIGVRCTVCGAIAHGGSTVPVSCPVNSSHAVVDYYDPCCSGSGKKCDNQACILVLHNVSSLPTKCPNCKKDPAKWVDINCKCQ